MAEGTEGISAIRSNGSAIFLAFKAMSASFGLIGNLFARPDGEPMVSRYSELVREAVGGIIPYLLFPISRPPSLS